MTDDSYSAWLQDLRVTDDPEIERAAFYRGALWYAARQHWKPGWAYYAFTARYGPDARPRHRWALDGPCEPTREHLHWIRQYRDSARRIPQSPTRRRGNVVSLDDYRRTAQLTA